MIETPTVLILGAGSSAHLGYPLGAKLISELCALPKSRNQEDILFVQRDSGAIEEFVKRLSRSGHYSIDAFLEQNPEHLEMGRLLIARQLKKQEAIERLFPPHDSGWYQYLFNKIISGGPERIHENALSIITFNYDRSLECYLHEAIQFRCSLSSDAAAERLRSLQIIHPHGTLGAYPEISYGQEASKDELLEISKGIKIIHELHDSPSGFCSREFEAANECLQQAERILFLGFGFHIDNVRRFNFFTKESVRGKEIKAAVAGLGTVTKREMLTRLDPFGFQDTIFDGNICNNFFDWGTSLH